MAAGRSPMDFRLGSTSRTIGSVEIEGAQAYVLDNSGVRVATSRWNGNRISHYNPQGKEIGYSTYSRTKNRMEHWEYDSRGNPRYRGYDLESGSTIRHFDQKDNLLGETTFPSLESEALRRLTREFAEEALSEASRNRRPYVEYREYEPNPEHYPSPENYERERGYEVEYREYEPDPPYYPEPGRRNEYAPPPPRARERYTGPPRRPPPSHRICGTRHHRHQPCPPLHRQCRTYHFRDEVCPAATRRRFR